MRLSKIVRLAASKAKQICGAFNANGTNNYIDTGIVPNQNTVMKFWGKFNNLSEQYHGCRVSAGNRFYVGINSLQQWAAGWNHFNVGGTADTGVHKFELRESNLYIDGELIVSVAPTTLDVPYSIFIYARNIGGVPDYFTNFTMYKAEITHNGSVHTWVFDQGNEAVVYTIDGAVQTPTTIQGTVLSSQWEDSCIDI